MKNCISSLLGSICLLSALSACAQLPGRHTVRLSSALVVASSDASQVAAEYEYRPRQGWGWVGEVVYRRHRLAKPGTRDWQYLENTQRQGGSVVSTDYKGKKPADLGSMV
ncbi:MAG TPA: hypothetical protein PK971_16585, partial [Saprospiraceae bacterium]|nr:hypothetical protein [Saprospiraceae bacterium]